jgi:hypothetical protein
MRLLTAAGRTRYGSLPVASCDAPEIHVVVQGRKQGICASRESVEDVRRLEALADIDKVEQEEARRAPAAERSAAVRVRQDPAPGSARRARDECGGTHEGTPFVVGASSGSDVRMSSSPKTATFRLWLIMYMWSVVPSGPAIRFTEQGNVGSVELNGGSQTCARARQHPRPRSRIARARTIWNSGRRYGTA